jgi:nitroreductase
MESDTKLALPQEGDTLPLPQPDKALLDFLSTRRSIKIAELTEPGPNAQTLEAILHLGARVPDHGKLGPWRFIIVTGEARATLGQKIADQFRLANPKADPAQLQAERTRFERAPSVIAVVSAAAPHGKIPEWEQVLSAGALCHSIMLAARAYGYGAVWLSEWVAYDRAALAVLGVSETEKLAGYIYIGTPSAAPIERQRPDVASRIRAWEAPN